MLEEYEEKGQTRQNPTACGQVLVDDQLGTIYRL